LTPDWHPVCTMNPYQFRLAELSDVPELQALITVSIRTLGLSDYSSAQIEGALLGAFGVDTQLIRDQTYFVAQSADGTLVACGGYSFRRTLFGSDQRSERDSTDLDPTVDAAKIRAFFVHPDHVRKGLGTQLLELSEKGAQRLGFSRFEMMATLPGVRLYQMMGYQPTQLIQYPLPNGEKIPFMPMYKSVPSSSR